jgi:LPS export ABC transporter protein LptC
MVLFGMLLLCVACHKEEAKMQKDYRGPMVIAKNVQTIFTDSAQPKIDLTAPIQNEYATGNRTFPAGITIWFYNEKGERESRLTANRAFYDKATEIYTGRGNVVVENMTKHERLKSEELKWSRYEKRVFTDKFVRIETPQETLLGEGLTAAQDFSTYKILKPKGVIPANRL